MENRPGAGGTLPVQALQQAKRDGHTLAPIPLGVFRLPDTKHDPLAPVKDITDLLGITGHAFGGVVPSKSSIKTWADFVAWAKANPGQLAYGSTGVLTSPHLRMQDITLHSGLELNHIPDKGSADLMQSLLGGQLMAAAESSSYAPHGAASCGRCAPGVSSAWPSSPRCRRARRWACQSCRRPPYGLGAPKGMEPALAARIHDAFEAAMEMPAHVEALARYDQRLLPMSPQQYSRFAQEDFKREKARVEKRGLAKPA